MIHYEIKSGDRLIYSSFRVNQDFAATNIKFVDEVGKVPTLAFDLPPDNPITLEVIKDEVQMYRNGEMIFNGNVKTRKRKFNKFVTYYCEGDLGYLHDVFIRPPFAGSSKEGTFITEVITKYNEPTPKKRPLTAGNINPGSDITYNIEDYTDCYDAISDNLFSIYNGGFLRTRHVKSGGSWTHNVDFFASPPSDPNAQKIVYAKNILDINDDDDGRDIVTHYIPLGATVDKDRVKLSGTDYISADTATLNDYGVIELVQDYSDVEDSGTLSTYANQDYAAMDLARKKRAVKIKAVDLAIVENAETPLQVGYMYEVYSHPHEIKFTGGDKKQLLRAEIDPNDPAKSYYWFGDVPKDSMRRIQADRALAEETRQRVQKEASYTNAVGVTNGKGISGTETYVSQASTDKTGGNDVTTASGVYDVSVKWDDVDITVGLDQSNFTVSSGSLKISGSLGVSGSLYASGYPTIEDEEKSFSGKLSVKNGSSLSVAQGSSLSVAQGSSLSASSAAMNLKKVLHKGITSEIPFHRQLGNATAIVSVIDTTGKIIGGTSAITGTKPKMTLYAIGNNPPQTVKVAVIAIGTEQGGRNTHDE
jgi:hypothetical protein